MNNLIFYIVLNFSYNTVSVSENGPTLANPAFTSFFGSYESYLSHKDIGVITYFNLSTRLKKFGLGFSSSDKEENRINERKNWLSSSFHFGLPFSLGLNLGVIKIADQTNPLVDFGIWSRYLLNFGLCYYNLLGEEKSVRIGISYLYRAFTGTLEIEENFQNREITPHFLLYFKQSIGNVNINLGAGYHPRRLVSKFKIGYSDFISAEVYLEEEPSFMIRIYFSPPVIVKEVAVVETLMVEKPLLVKKIKKYELTQEKLNYCEVHYRKGIEYYLKNELEKAIEEWNLVINVYPSYKDVARYRDTAKKKLELLKK